MMHGEKGKSKISILEVDDALTIIIDEFDKMTQNTHECYFITIQSLAKVMHPHRWKYREEILQKIQEWAEKRPYHSIWIDKKGRKWKIGYGEQMHPVYGSFRKYEGKRDEYFYNILKLWRV